MPIILAIIKDQQERDRLQSELHELQANLFVKDDPDTGIDYAKTLNPDIIILDIVPEKTFAKAFLQKIRGDDITRETPVIMLILKGNKKEYAEYLEDDELDFLIRPYKVAELHERVRSAIHFREMKKIEKATDDSQKIYLSEDRNMVVLTFATNLQGKKFTDDVLRLFNIKFLKKIMNREIVIDLRPVAQFSTSDITMLNIILKQFGSKKVNIVAGRHYGIIVSYSDIEERCNLFITFGDMEMFLHAAPGKP